MAELTPRLNVLGAGRAGRAVARVLVSTGRVEMGWIVNRSPGSARAAAAFIGDGEPLSAPAALDGHDWLLLGLPDSRLPTAAAELAGQGIGTPALAFHLGGGTGAGALSPLGCPAAAVHPVRPFADPAAAVTGFAGTWCVASGDSSAVDPVVAALTAAGGRILRLDDADRRLYHAATVAASNYLVTLTGLARALAAASGMEPDAAASLLADLQSLTLAGLTGRDPAVVLTGPVERGDIQTCRELVAAVDDAAPVQAGLFRALGRATVALARERHPDRCDWEALARVFSPDRSRRN